MRSAFSPLLIDFNNKKAVEQAQFILDEVERLRILGYKKIGITYSANHGQTETIRACYKKNNWITGTNGANQADVIHELEILLERDKKYQHLKGIFRILPITTMGSKQDLTRWVPEDLEEITRFIKENDNVVLGWQNQKINGDRYAIGGGISNDLLNAGLSSTVQNHLRALSQQHPLPKTKAIPAKKDIKDITSSKPMFQPPKKTSKQIPVTEKIKHVSDEIYDAMKAHKHVRSEPIIRPGNLAHTFKIAFDNAADATQFFNYLKSLNYNVTYFNQNGDEKYPMDKEGNVVVDKNHPVQYRDIIRFEVRPNEKFPEDALRYLHDQLGLSNADKLYSQIMGKEALKTLSMK